jgi:hypothetical protein
MNFLEVVNTVLFEKDKLNRNVGRTIANVGPLGPCKVKAVQLKSGVPQFTITPISNAEKKKLGNSHRI